MIFSVMLLAAGVLITAVGLLGRRRNRYRVIPVVLLGIGVGLLLFGVWRCCGSYARDRQQKEYIYLSMRCLQNQDAPGAVYYLSKTSVSGTCAAAAARSILENSRGNLMIARINRDIARSKAEGRLLRRTSEGDLVSLLDEYLRAGEADIEKQSELIACLVRLLGIRPARQAILDGYAQSGELPDEVLAQMGLSETVRTRMQINGLLQNSRYMDAVREAAALVNRDGSVKNRLLLAETVAECAYSGKDYLPEGRLPDETFSLPDKVGNILPDSSAQRERDSLRRRYEAVQNDILKLENSREAETSAGMEKKLNLAERAAKLQKRADQLFVYRGFNAIENIHTVEAGIMRARLCFSLQEYDRAEAELLAVRRDIVAMLLDSQNAGDQIASLEKEGDALFYESLEYQDALVRLLTIPCSDLRYIAQTPLTTDFMRYLVSARKVYGQELFLTRVDVSGYPAVTVRVSGREDLLQKILDGGKGAVVQDSGRTVSYTAKQIQTENTSISVVVDRSGSMSWVGDAGYAGQSATRLENLKAALDEFIHNMDDKTQAALVAFSDDAEELVELTADRGRLLASVNGLYADGGTNVTQGIRVGTDALRNASGDRVMLLMTDGEFELDYSAVNEAIDAHVMIDTIGFGTAGQEDLERIAQMTGGQYVRADSSSELRNVYASLQRIIGHTLELSYDAEDAGEADTEAPGYVFVRTEGMPGIRAEYIPPDTAERARLDVCSPALLDIRTGGANIETSLTFAGERLAKVREIWVDGQEGTITFQSENRLDVSVSVTPAAGWLDVEIRGEDESRQIFPHLLAAGIPERLPDIRVGCLTISSPQGISLADGFLLGGEQIQIAQSEPVPRHFSVWGFLEIAGLPGAASGMERVDLGSQGMIRGWGEMTLSNQGWDNYRLPAVLTGTWELHCTNRLQLKQLATSDEEVE